MPSVNKVILIGHAGAAPEVRQFDNGNKVANARIAVSERYTDRNGNQVDNTEWIPLVFNGKLADIAAQYIQKGMPVFVEGKWRTRKWTDQQGVEHYATECLVGNLQLLGQRPQAPQPQQAAPAPQYAPAPQPAPQYHQAPQPYYQQSPARQYAPQPGPTLQPPVNPDDDLPF